MQFFRECPGQAEWRISMTYTICQEFLILKGRYLSKRSKAPWFTEIENCQMMSSMKLQILRAAMHWIRCGRPSSPQKSQGYCLMRYWIGWQHFSNRFIRTFWKKQLLTNGGVVRVRCGYKNGNWIPMDIRKEKASTFIIRRTVIIRCCVSTDWPAIC